ncbi:MAG TPA: carboxypeptidase regulatory-like domain-containing protein [Gemmatimonadota bacterium]|nr:carboxypeptidase regulatory-like domain-containing protein [Gemmatimonadota bacterium]
MVPPLRTPRFIAGVAAVLLAAAPAASQSIHGRLTEEGSGVPVAGAFVVLLDVSKAQRDVALTDADGRFIVVAPAAGRYVIGVDRIGYLSTSSDPIELEAGRVVQYHLSTLVAPVELADIGVTIESDCTVRPEEDADAGRLWEEVSKTLNVTAFAQNRGLLHYAVTARKRQLDPYNLRVRSEQSRSLTGLSRGSPYVALPPQALADEGFVRFQGEEVVYYGPDAETLLSDEFLDGHCFAVREPPPEHPDWVGLAFAPARNRRQPDIEGTLWVDVPTGELRQLDYEYTNLPAALEGKGAGGRIEFARLDSGEGYISRWGILMPVIRMADNRAYSHLNMDIASRLATVIRVDEDSGEVDRIEPARSAGAVPLASAERRWSEPLEIPPPATEPAPPEAGEAGIALRRLPGGATARFTVTALDASTGAPIEGAQVHLPGLDLGGTTGPEGRLDVSSVPAGERTFTVERLGYRSMEATVALTAGEAVEIEARLAPAPIEVQEVSATVEAAPDMGMGLARTVITADDIPRNSPLSVLELIDRRIPGTRVGRSSASGCPIIETRNGVIDLVVVDGQRFHDTCVLDMVLTTDIRRLEMRVGVSASIEFGHSYGGAIVIETFHGVE